jgi:hypothetical protein
MAYTTAGIYCLKLRTGFILLAKACKCPNPRLPLGRQEIVSNKTRKS